MVADLVDYPDTEPRQTYSEWLQQKRTVVNWKRNTIIKQGGLECNTKNTDAFLPLSERMANKHVREVAKLSAAMLKALEEIELKAKWWQKNRLNLRRFFKNVIENI